MRSKLNKHAGLIIFAVLALALGVYVLIVNAWVAEDAYITLRVVENFTHYLGPDYNAGYRVQVYTHPLWMLTLSAIYWSLNHLIPAYPLFSLYNITVVTSIALSLATFALLIFHRRQPSLTGILAVLLLLTSKAFIDFTVSGLENPLSNVLITLFVILFIHWQRPSVRQIGILALIAALATVNRQDLLLLFLPALAILFWDHPHKARAAFAIVLGFLPLIFWEAFSVLYYGFPVPNTAYAKLNTGIPASLQFQQGLRYIFHLFTHDYPTALMLIALLIIVGVKPARKNMVIALGALLYTLYVLKIGGDFMAGRFFTAPLILLAAALSTQLHRRWSVYLLLSITILSLPFADYPLLSGANYKAEVHFTELIAQDGIADERGVYYWRGGLLSDRRGIFTKQNYWKDWWFPKKSGMIVNTNLGYKGYLEGPQVLFLDEFALADPLLSKLPVENPTDWRIGHFNRTIPQGYELTLETGQNQIVDPNLHEYYDQLLLILQGDLFSPERLATIWRFNTGQYDYLLDEYLAAQ